MSQIVVVWDKKLNPPSEIPDYAGEFYRNLSQDLREKLVRIERCKCGTVVSIFERDDEEYDSWKNHFDYCEAVEEDAEE